MGQQSRLRRERKTARVQTRIRGANPVPVLVPDDGGIGHRMKAAHECMKGGFFRNELAHRWRTKGINRPPAELGAMARNMLIAWGFDMLGVDVVAQVVPADDLNQLSLKLRVVERPATPELSLSI